MTSSTGTEEHPEVAEISALADGSLPPARAAEVRGHLVDCELCAEVEASLEEIRSLLGTLPGPVRMPDDVANRIDAALAAEALLDATAPHDDAAVSRETAASVDHVSRETPLCVSRETSSTPSEGKDETVSPGADRPAGRPRAATTGPGRGSSRRSTVRRTDTRRWPKALLGAACAAAVLGVGTFLVQNTGTSSNDADGGADKSAAAGRESGGLTAASLEGRVQKLLADRKASATAGLDSQNSPDVPMRAEDPVVPTCVKAGTGRSEIPLAAHEETYNGTKAFVVVLPHPKDGSLVDAFVIASACVSKSPSPAGALLVTRTYTRD